MHRQRAQTAIRQILKGARFCGKCGTNLDVANKPTKAGITCDKCGTNIPRGSKFCPNCADEINPCPECDEDNDKSASICRSCGKTLPVPCPKCAVPVAPNSKFSTHAKQVDAVMRQVWVGRICKRQVLQQLRPPADSDSITSARLLP